jgi:YHS domain-containing protein
LVILPSLAVTHASTSQPTNRTRLLCATTRPSPGKSVAFSDGLAKIVSRSYISPSDGRPAETEGTSKMKKYLIASALIVAFAGSAYAANGQFGNMCSWGLANHKDVQTDCSVNATINGKTYCFSSADAKSQFMKNPSSNLTKAESFYKSEHKG